MKESLWGYYLVLLGIMVSTVMILMSNMVTTNQQDYYLLKEACQHLKTISGYKDADGLLVRYEGILADYEAKLAKKKEEAAKAKVERIKKAKTISLFSGFE